ncbi:MAG: phage tail protein I [Pseudomonadota bacterium]|nr:phage tail protein I [Pseudomonadota bacterium]
MTLLPPSCTELQYSVEAIDAERIDLLPIPHRTIWSADDCPAHLLPWLAWSVSVDVWRDSWPESVKRETIRNAADAHRFKGTAGAVKRAVAAIGADITITEWWQTDPLGSPYTFAVEFTPSATLPNDIEFQEDVISSIDASKNLRSSYTLTVRVPETLTLHSEPVLRSATIARIGSPDTAGDVLALPISIPLNNTDAETDTSGWTVLQGELNRIEAPYDYFTPGVFTGAQTGYSSAYQDWLIPLRARTPVRESRAQLAYTYWTSDTTNAQLCIECFAGDGESLGVYLPDAIDDGISQISATVDIPAATNVIRFLQQYDADADAGNDLFIDLITATLNEAPQL